jgi:amino acid transporter
MSASNPTTTLADQGVTLRRSLGLSGLILYGIIVIQPTAPMPVFGVIYTAARGHVVTAVSLAMIAMLLTAVSYGHMARLHPQAGSAFTYVGKELHPAGGYLAGWCMAMDYVLNPLICTIWCSKAAQNFVPGVPYVVWAIAFATMFTLLNLNGVETSARLNAALAAALGIVILMFVVAALRFMMRAGLYGDWRNFTLPFYDPSTFSPPAVLHGTSLAVLTYIGFDGITTLSEEAHDPECNVPRAVVLTCLVTGILAGIEVYLGQIVWGHSGAFPEIDTAFVHVAARAGGPALFIAVNAALLVATIGSGMGAQLGAARLLYAMGRDGALPARFFAAIEPHKRIPRNNVLLIGVVSLIGALLITYETGAELLNFGALLAFMGVNLSSVRHSLRFQERGRWALVVFGIAGFLICFLLWLNLSTLGKIAGSSWACLGILLWFARRKAMKEAQG